MASIISPLLISFEDEDIPPFQRRGDILLYTCTLKENTLLFELTWWNGEEWTSCEMEGDSETIRETFLREEAEDGNSVDNLSISPL